MSEELVKNGDNRTTCPVCEGTGKCLVCDGRGKRTSRYREMDGFGPWKKEVVRSQEMDCYMCIIRKGSCIACKGTGYIEGETTEKRKRGFRADREVQLELRRYLDTVHESASREQEMVEFNERMAAITEKWKNEGTAKDTGPGEQGSGRSGSGCFICEHTGKCLFCDGKGTVTGRRKVVVQKWFSKKEVVQTMEMDCTACNGGGKCVVCKGTGYISAVEAAKGEEYWKGIKKKFLESKEQIRKMNEI